MTAISFAQCTFIIFLSILLAACANEPGRRASKKQAVEITKQSAIDGQAPPVAQRVTFYRLLGARNEPHNWLTHYGAYDGQRYSPLDQINTDNVKNLRPVWVFQHASVKLMAGHATYAFEATPIVVDGVMYVSGWDGYVWALDAATGKVFWQYQHAVPLDTPLCCGNINRGVAVANGKVSTLRWTPISLHSTR